MIREVRPLLTAHSKQNGRHLKNDGEPAFTIKPSNEQAIVIDDDLIRRLTEIECERLQGFDDDWTKFGDYDGVTKEVAATNRYKCLGNAVTTHVVEAVAESIIELIR